MAQRQHHDAQLGGLPTADFDYTFTEHELADILGFMENQQQQSEGPQLPSQSHMAGSSTTVPLQFQPHTADSGGQPVTPTHSGGSQSDEGVTIKREPSLGPGFPPGNLDPSGSFGGLNGYYPKPNTAATSRSPLASAPAEALPLEARGPSGSMPSTAPASSRKEAAKGHVSHSTVEKQRRDRINALIDELRDLVPPQSANSIAQDGMDSKRPKHVVLSDAIQLIRDLQDKARISDSPGDLESGQGAADLFHRSNLDPLGRSESDHVKTISPPELPLAPEGALPSSGVVVEQGEGCLYVKVNCKDRRGLLSDIITSLKAIPVEITTAAVTTTSGGYVHDVFQVKMELDSKVSPQDIQCHVHATMYSLTENHLGDKRRRVRG